MTVLPSEGSEGSSVYVLLSKDHRVSRSFRATWHLRSLLTSQSWAESSSDDLSVLSVLGGAAGGMSTTPDVFYICQQYSLVFVLDMTPTMVQVSNQTCQVKLNEAVASLTASLNLLTKPFCVPGSEELLEPEVTVTVLTYCGNHHGSVKPVQVLLQGFCLKSSNCHEIAQKVAADITALENQLSRGKHEEQDSRGQEICNSEASLEGLIKFGTLALQLLPRNALKGLVVLTDGVLGFTSPNNMHNSVNQMRGANTSCWVIQVGGRSEPSAAFGLMPDSETLNFLSLACNGCVIQPAKVLKASKKAVPGSLNILHEAILLWSYQQTAHARRVRGVVDDYWGVGQVEEEEEHLSPTIYRQFDKNTIHAPLLCVIGCRVRDGFFLKSATVREQDLTLEVVMYYPWQASVNIYYTIQSPWPLPESSTTLNTTISYDGPYSFVHDIHCNLNEPITSYFRAAAVRKFKQVLKSQSYSDTFLAHFLSFSATPNYHTLPQKIQDGMPLFHLPPNQSKPVPAVSLSSSGERKKKESALVNFWSPLCTIDTNLWYRWFHTDKIILILHQDTVLPRNLLSPSANHRFATVQCRISASKLFNYLKTWSSFVLLENQSFIRFLPSTESPLYFSLVRVAQKHPCIVLHVGHIEGTPHSLQVETVRELQEALLGLNMERVQPSKRSRSSGSARGKAAKPCAFLVQKQLQRVMIRYDGGAGTPYQSTAMSLTQGGLSETERLVQNDYLTGMAWQWIVPHSLPTLLTALLRHRLKEGFHIARAQSGIVTLTAQLSVSQPHSPSSLPMLLQYIIFPLSTNPTTSFSSSSATGALVGYPTCELWVEPQYGTVTETPPGLQYILGSTHSEIADKIHTKDKELMLTVSSFIYLHYMCERGCHALPRAPLEEEGDPREVAGYSLSSSVPRPVLVPFQVARLFSKCRVVGFALDAFPEATMKQRLYSPHQSSALNTLFWKQLFEKLRELAPTEVPLSNTPLSSSTNPASSPSSPSSSSSPSSLVQRILSSESLREFCQLCDIGGKETSDTEWRCLAMTPSEKENTICLFLVPDVFFRGSSATKFNLEDKMVEEKEKIGNGEAGEEGEGKEEEIKEEGEKEDLPSDVFFLPLLLLHCDQDILLDPDPAMPAPPSLLPDVYQHLTLALSHSPSPPSPLAPLTTPISTPIPSPQTSIDASTTKSSSDPLAKLYSSLANESLCKLVSKLRALHFSSYLHTIHTTLTHKKPIPSTGFHSAVDICARTTMSLDCTPLVGALCRHCRLSYLSSPPPSTGRHTGKELHNTGGKSEVDENVEAQEQQTTTPSASDRTDTSADVAASPGISADVAASPGISVEYLPFVPETLARLIQRTLSCSTEPVRSSSYRLELLGYHDDEEEETLEQVPHCIQWEGEPQRVFLNHLSETGFEAVPSCPGYFWLREDTESPQKRAKKLSRGGSEEDDEEALVSSPSEASTIKRKQSLTVDNTTLRSEESDRESESTGDDPDMAALSPLFSPSEPHFMESSRGEPTLPIAPLFLHISCSVRQHSQEQDGVDGGEGEVPTQPPYIPICLKSILFPDSLMCSQPNNLSTSHSVFLTLSFLSFCPETVTLPATSRPTTDDSEEFSEGVYWSESSCVPLKYHSQISAIKQKLEWLMADELISVSRDCPPVTLPLLQAVDTHVHTTHSVSSCLHVELPLKFVFGAQKSMLHLIMTELEAVEIPGFSLEKMGDEYYYLSPAPFPLLSLPNTPDILDHAPENMTTMSGSLSVPWLPPRSETPSSSGLGGQQREKGQGHRRSTSMGVFSSSSSLNVTPVPLGNVGTRRRGSVQGLPAIGMDTFPSNNSLAQADSSYDASRSSSCSELSVRPPPPLGPLDTPPFWLLLRVVPEEIQLIFQIRHSVADLKGCLAKLDPLLTALREKAREACHRANQLLLLRDMLETRQCSHLLLPEGLSEAWVENVVHKRMPSLMEGGGCGLEGLFSPQQFQCELQWSKHITPHYRLKSMKMNIRKALQITRVALDAFAVTNRKDVYVFQDVQEDAAESIFYLKIDESLCRVDDTVETDDSPVGYDRCDTRATEAETMSTASYHPSVSVSDPVGQDPERQSLAESLVDQPGKPRESLVLQLYGINKPSQSLLERLTHRIIFKLDDAALEIMCGLYARNQKLKFTPSDIQFLQPPGATPSRQLRILVPLWVREVHALFFYFLQLLSTLALKPKYASQEPHIQFQVPQSIQNMCLSAGLPAELHQDLLFLYIRPHTQGRGIAVFSVSLTDSSGRLVAPQPSEVSPREGGWNPANLDLTFSVCAQGTEAVLEDDQVPPHRGGGYQLKVDIWEKGNVGITDLSAKLHLCLKQALCDYILELYFLPQPIARIDEMFQLDDSPSATSPFVVLEPSPPELSRRESLDSPRRALFEKGEVRVPSSLGFLSQRSQETAAVLSPDTPVQGEPHRSRCDTVTVAAAMDDVFSSLEGSGKDDNTFDQPTEVAGIEVASSAAGLTWQEKEMNRREMEALDAYQKEAYHGKQGALENTYSSLIPQHFAETRRLSSRSVAHYPFPLLGSYSAEVFLNETLSLCSAICHDMTLSTFKLGSNGGYTHYIPQKTSRVRSAVEVEETKFFVVGRNLKQWDEARSPDVVEIRLTQPWFDAHAKQSLQMFHPLDSKKISKTVDYPLTSLAKDRPCFIPRQRLLLLSVSHKMAELWLYNLSEELVVQVRKGLDGLNKWQQTRAGFLHHLLAQKMGLFQHTHAQDLREWTTAAANHCSSLQDTIVLYRNPAPVSTASSQRQQRPQPILALESLYQEVVPTGHTPHTMDPVYNHGHQVRESHAHFRRTYESRDLLGKVFTSWPNHTGAGAVPVEASLIRQLKRLARLLHFCSSRLLLRPPPAPPGHTPSPDQTTWFDGIRNEALSQYIQYLKTLNFEEITERASPQLQPRRGGGGGHTPSRPPQPAPPVSTLPQPFYKCMQRSWTHGIILVELTFVEERFDVKLLTLESSRLNGGQKSLNPEAHTLFSSECARYKDLIHLHSFMHDFHLNVVLGMVSGQREIPEWLDLKAFLEQFTRANRHQPTFNRHRLERGQIKVPLHNVKPAQLYHHILAHSDVFNMHTLELGPAGKTTASSTGDICLHIDVSPQSLGPTTSPQLSKILQDAQESYSIHVVAMCDDANPHCLVLAFYLLLVNIREKFPRLTRDTHSSSIMAVSSTSYNVLLSPDELTQSSETELHLSVRKRRIKLGLDPHQRSTASQLVVDGTLIKEHMQSLQGHFEGVVKNALHHMRRDELWKRMLYGGHKSDPSKPAMMQAPFEQLRCEEFRELLRLVTVSPLEKLDPQLSALRRQTKKCFRRLMSAMKIRFSESVRVYKTEDENYFFTVVINPDWSDMVALAQSDRDGKSQGLYAVYRKPKEGSLVPQDQRPITAHVEADQQHIENIVNFCCSYLWASMLDSTPPQPQLNLL